MITAECTKAGNFATFSENVNNTGHPVLAVNVVLDYNFI